MSKLKYLLFLIPFLLIEDTFALNLAQYTYSPTQLCSTPYRYAYTLKSDPINFKTGKIGSGGTYNVSGVLSCLSMAINYPLKANNNYSIRLRNPNNSPYWYKPNTENVSIALGSGSFNDCGTVDLRVNPTNIEIDGSYITFYFTTPSGTWTNFGLEINDELTGYTLTGGSNFRINNDINLVDESAVSEDENTQDIIDNNNQNTQDIIDNQNENTDKIIDELTDCRDSYNLFPGWILYKGINSNNGSIIDRDNSAISSDYISVDFASNSNYYLSGLNSELRTFVAAYNSNKQFLGRTGANNLSNILLSSNSFSSGTSQGSGSIAYIRVTSYKTDTDTGTVEDVKNLKTMFNVGSSAKTYEPFGEQVCKSKIDDVNDSINGLTGAITDNSPPDTSGLIDAPGWLPPGPVDSIATLPINLLQSLTNNLDSACTPINIKLPFVNSNLSLPCPGTILRQIEGFWLFWEGFGLIAGIWCLYKYFINLYKWVESHLSMDEKESLGKWGGV